jgi:hypothetical protein
LTVETTKLSLKVHTIVGSPVRGKKACKGRGCKKFGAISWGSRIEKNLLGCNY